jgi:hypothetical protein
MSGASANSSTTFRDQLAAQEREKASTPVLTKISRVVIALCVALGLYFQYYQFFFFSIYLREVGLYITAAKFAILTVLPILGAIFQTKEGFDGTHGFWITFVVLMLCGGAGHTMFSGDYLNLIILVALFIGRLAYTFRYKPLGSDGPGTA